MDKAKKIFSIVISAIIVICSTTLAFATEENIVSHAEFTDSLTKMIETYDPVFDGFSLDESWGTEPIRTNRLMIKTDSNDPFNNTAGAIDMVEGYNNLHILQYSDSSSAETAYSFFEDQNNVIYVEYDLLFCIDEEESEDVADSSDHLSWGNSAIKSDVVNQMLISSGINFDEVIVGLFDSGVEHNNALIDDSRVLDGYKTEEGTENDIYGHGTSMAGIILDNTPTNVKIKPYCISTWYGGVYLSEIINTIPLAVSNGVDIINMSFRFYGTEYSSLLFEVNNAIEQGVTFVVAAGNENKDASLCYPAMFSNVITVAATDSDNNPWKKSNWGECVDISAPGVDITMINVSGGTYTASGTSASVPFVVSAVAILKSINPSLKPQEIKEKIKKSAFVPENWNSNKYGAGILDCEKMLSDMISARPLISLNGRVATISAPNSNIYYTIDGSNPVVGCSSLYSEPINTDNADTIMALAVEKGKLPSIVVSRKIKRIESITVRYKGTEKLPINPDEEIGACYVANENIVTYEGKGKIKAHSIGETQVVAFLSNNCRVTYNVTVEYAWWQWLIRIFLLGIFWY